MKRKIFVPVIAVALSCLCLQFLTALAKADAIYLINYLFTGGPPPGCE